MEPTILADHAGEPSLILVLGPALVLGLGLSKLHSDDGHLERDARLPDPAVPCQCPGVSPSVIGLIEGFADSVASLLRLVSGAISDRVGRRKLLVGIGTM